MAFSTCFGSWLFQLILSMHPQICFGPWLSEPILVHDYLNLWVFGPWLSEPMGFSVYFGSFLIIRHKQPPTTLRVISHLIPGRDISERTDSTIHDVRILWIIRLTVAQLHKTAWSSWWENINIWRCYNTNKAHKVRSSLAGPFIFLTEISYLIKIPSKNDKTKIIKDNKVL